MRSTATESSTAQIPSPRSSTADWLRTFYQGQRDLRKGICLLNAGQFDKAAELLTQASVASSGGGELGDCLLAALTGAGRFEDAAVESARLVEDDPENVGKIVHFAMLQWKSGQTRQAIRTLRQAIADHIDDAELHFQLGTMLAATDETEEAELRFTQAIAIDKNHAEALVNLAMCRGVRRDISGSLQYLERAQHLQPGNTRITLLLATAAAAARDVGDFVCVRAEMPENPTSSSVNMTKLGEAIQRDPEFVEAFLSLDETQVDESVFRLLIATLQQAIELNPHRANLHYLEGKVWARLGQHDDAIQAVERAVALDPRCIQALILLARLYESTDHSADATSRLEETLRLGAEYADTYLLLGNLYRDSGQLKRARWAYEKALEINERYDAAKEALAGLAA